MAGLEQYQRVLESIRENRRFVLASVVRARGSTPQKAGANALIEQSGKVFGTLGGGCLEAESLQRALRALDTGAPRVFDLNLDDISGWDDGLICGGNVRVFLNTKASLNVEDYTRALEAKANGERGALVTIINHPSYETGKAFWISGQEFESHSLLKGNEQFQTLIKSGKSGVAIADAIEIYVEPIVPSPKLIIAGAGHIGQAVTALSSSVGFEVTVIDDRPSFANLERLPSARSVVCGDIANEMKDQIVTEDTYILIVTRGHRHDGQVLASCVNRGAVYIGMIGSRRKSLLIRKGLVEEGLAAQADIDEVVSPVGLDIGAESIEEIAISIVAQLISFRKQGRLSAGSKNYSQNDRAVQSSCSIELPNDQADWTA